MHLFSGLLEISRPHVLEYDYRHGIHICISFKDSLDKKICIMNINMYNFKNQAKGHLSKIYYI